MQVKKHRFGWPVLNKIIEEITKAVNSNEPIQGDGIRITDSDRGKVISAAPQGSGSNANTSGQQQASTQGTLIQIQAIDPASKNIVTLKVYSDGNGFSTSENDWVSVNSVDPTTCQTTPLTLLKKPK